MSAIGFKERLEKELKCDIELILNNNRSTMLSLLEKRRNGVRLSVHKMFLDAPENVVSAIVEYVNGIRGESNRVLRGYIQENLSRFDARSKLDHSKLVQQGRVYDLKPLYEKVNAHYFEGKLELLLTWYGAWGRNNRSHITFGQYLDNLKLVKMHRILDDAFFPEFFVEFVLYHEMLHSVIRGKRDASGRYQMHGKEFKERERLFERYDEAIAWEKKNKKHFFKRRWF